MITTLLIAHITLMSLSLVVTMATVFVSVLGSRVSRAIINSNIAGTSLGLLCGSVLLFAAPLDAKCITLGVYLLAFVSVQVYITRRNQSLPSSSSVV